MADILWNLNFFGAFLDMDGAFFRAGFSCRVHGNDKKGRSDGDLINLADCGHKKAPVLTEAFL